MPFSIRPFRRFPVHCSVSCLVACVFVLLVVTHSFALAQDSYDEIPKQQLTDALERAKVVGDEISKHQERYSRLYDEYITSLRRMNTVELFDAREKERSFLFEVGNNLDRANVDLSALQGHMNLASMVTRKQLLPSAMKLVNIYRTAMIKRTRAFSQFVEQSLHLSRDQETTRLMLEARDLFRSSTELLDRLQVTETTTQ